MQGPIIHAKAWFFENGGTSDIINAAGVRVWFSIIRAEGAHRRGGLPCWRDAFEFVTEILEVIWADPQLQHFLNHRQEIGQ